MDVQEVAKYSTSNCYVVIWSIGLGKSRLHTSKRSSTTSFVPAHQKTEDLMHENDRSSNAVRQLM